MGNYIIGKNSIIEGNVLIEDNVKIGNNCIIKEDKKNKTIIKEGCVIDDFVSIYPGVVIRKNCKIGAYSILGYPTKADLLGKDVSVYSDKVKDKIIKERILHIGENSVIRSHSVIYSHVKIGNNFNTGHFVMIREHTTIGDNCVFGTHASCDGFANMGDKTQIGQSCMLAQAATIGKKCFIGGHTVFSDNKNIIRDVKYDLNGSRIGDYVRIGLNCIVFPDVTVGENAFIGAGSLINKDIPENKLAYGNPIKIIRNLREEEINKYKSSF